MSAEGAVIHVRDLKKTFFQTRREPGFGPALRALFRPERHAVEGVRGVTFDVARGERVAFIGPNGAGKSTTIKMLTGILHPTSGEARVLGRVPWKERKALVARLGCVFGQRSQLWYHLPVGETFRLLSRVYDVPEGKARERLSRLSELFELDPLLTRPVRQLSLGQRMRCELAASLLHEPDIVFLDEPTIGLDVVARMKIRDLLCHMNETEGVTVFLTSHDAGDIEQVCDRVLLINDGSVLLDTSVERLKSEHLAEKRVEAIIDEPTVDIALPGVRSLPTEPHRLALRVDTSLTPVDRVIAKIAEAARVKDITVSNPPLEAVIASLYVR
ncbi:MAG: ATP-binding cassette domain-containing protein [Acidobacteriota bacterium]